MRWTIVAVVALVGCGIDRDGRPVRASLSDGQILSGEVRTDVLRLQGGLGELAIPLGDIGEIVPVEGGQLGDAHGNVTVWLRDGSELVGKWADPELTVGIEVGGQTIDVELPMDELNRLQTSAGPIPPEGTAYRVHTTYGDDLIVDPDRTRLVIDNDLGTFAPYLSECVSAAPIGDPTGDWRIELENGTVLVGPLRDSAITFGLGLGPDEVTVQLADFSWLNRVYFEPVKEQTVHVYAGEASSPAAPAAAPARAAGDWFDNGGLKREKQLQDQH